MVLLTHRTLNFDIHAVKPHFLPHTVLTQIQKMQIRKSMKRIQGLGRYAHVTVIFEFSLKF